MKALLYPLLFTSVISAQEWKWAKAYGKNNYYEEGTSVATDKDGNLYVSGISKTICNNCPSDYYSILSKYNPHGAIIWTDTIPFYEQRSATDKEGNTYVVSGGRSAKYDKSGIQLWQKDEPLERWSNVRVHSKGGFVVSGVDPAAQGKAVIARFDVDGNLIWKRPCDCWGLCCGPDPLACDAQGNVYFVAGTVKDEEVYRGFLFKFNESGQLIYKVNTPKEISALGVGRDNSPVVAGLISGPQKIGNAIYPDGLPVRGFIMKYDSTGKESWSHIIDGPLFDLKDIVINDNNETFLAGSHVRILTIQNTTINSSGVFVAKFSAGGEIKWIQHDEKNTSNPASRYFSNLKDITLNLNGNIILVGNFAGEGNFGNHTVIAPQDPDYYFDMLLAEISDDSKGVGIMEESFIPLNNLAVFPNPGERFFNVSFKERIGRNTLKVINVLGSVLYFETLDINSPDYQKTLDLHSLTKGVYFVIVEGSESRESRRIIIQ